MMHQKIFVYIFLCLFLLSCQDERNLRTGLKPAPAKKYQVSLENELIGSADPIKPKEAVKGFDFDEINNEFEKGITIQEKKELGAKKEKRNLKKEIYDRTQGLVSCLNEAKVPLDLNHIQVELFLDVTARVRQVGLNLSDKEVKVCMERMLESIKLEEDDQLFPAHLSLNYQVIKKERKVEKKEEVIRPFGLPTEESH